MLRDRNVIVLDIDRTLAREREAGQSYEDVLPHRAVLSKLREYRENGFYIIVYTSREMNLHQGNLGRILAKTAPTLFAWLVKHDVPYDEIYFGKPWTGKNGFFVDDRAIRPSEFAQLTFQEIEALLSHEQVLLRELEASKTASTESA